MNVADLYSVTLWVIFVLVAVGVVGGLLFVWLWDGLTHRLDDTWSES